MTRKLQILISASAGSILAFSTLAQDTPIPKTDSPSYTCERAAEAQRTDRLTGPYYDEQPYFVANPFGATSKDVKLVQSLPRHMDGTIDTYSTRTVESVRNKDAVRKVAASQYTLSTRNPDGTWNREYSPNGHGTYSSWSNLGYGQNTRQRMDVDNTQRNVRDRDNRALSAQEPDNTRRNVRDRNDQTLTPLNQGNSKSDRDTTAQIRQEIIAGEDLSVNARNVKIITIDGCVTLRGPVNTAEEKRLIGAIADRIVTSGNVDNQLEVKSTK